MYIRPSSLTSRGWHNVQCRCPRPSQISMRSVEQALVTGVRVRGGHRSLDDSKLIVKDLDKWSQAVGGARCVGQNVACFVGVLISVDAHNVGWDSVCQSIKSDI